MTTATLAAPLELRTLTLEQLRRAWNAGEVTFDAVEAECNRRDATERRAATIRARQSEWFDSAHAQYIRADIECRGELLSPEGQRAVADPISLWRGSEATAMRYASEELREWWYVNGRVTPAQYARELAASKRDERETYRAERAPAASTADMAADLAADVASRRAPARESARLVRPARPAVRPVTWPALPIARAASADMAAELAASVAARPAAPAHRTGRYRQVHASTDQLRRYGRIAGRADSGR